MVNFNAMKKPLVVSSLVLFSISSYAQVVLNCQQESLLFPKQVLSTSHDTLDVLADHSQISGKDHYSLSGNVSLNSSEYYLAADRVDIQKSNKTSTANGQVKFQDAEIMLTGERAIIKKQNGDTHTTLEQVNFHYPDSRINGQAQQIVSSGGVQVFDAANYSLCPIGNSDWRMNADKITLNTNTNRGQAEDVSIEFLGVPIFYSPFHSWVLEGRGSGFLAPSFSSYNESVAGEDNSYQVRIPYYFNIAADRDFLLTLNQLSSRGSVVEGKYRQLIEPNQYWDQGRFELEAHYLAEDDITSAKRWLAKADVDLSLNAKTQLSLNTHRVSDTNYFKEIVHDNTSISRLSSQIKLAHIDREQNLNISLFSEDEQLVNGGSAEYTRAPEFFISKGFSGLENRHLDLSLVSTQFKHDTATDTGVRTHVQAVLGQSINTHAYQLNPKLILSNTDYALDNQADQSKSMARFALEGKWFLERELSLSGKNLVQTLTPRFAYHYSDEKDLGVYYDSELKSDSYANLFSGEKYTGLDRVAKANDIVWGLESEFIDVDSGDTYLSLKMAQALYGDNGADRDYSDIAAGMDFRLGDLVINTELQYDPQSKQVDKTDSALTYRLGKRKFVTLAHHDDGSQESAEAYVVYPLSDKVHVFAGVNRSLTDAITNKQTGGIAYESCCWALRLAHFKEHISGADYDHVTNFELVLKGLASTSPSLRRKLEAEIPNYLADLDNY